MDCNDIMRAMEARLKEKYPEDKVYWDRLPKEFSRPSFTLELQKNETADANLFLVRRTAVVLVTIWVEVNAFYDSSREELNDRQDQVLALFSKPLKVGDRTLLPMVQKGEGTPELSEAAVTFQWMDDRPGFVDEDTAPESESGVPLMEDFALQVGTQKPNDSDEKKE